MALKNGMTGLSEGVEFIRKIGMNLRFLIGDVACKVLVKGNSRSNETYNMICFSISWKRWLYIIRLVLVLKGYEKPFINALEDGFICK